MKLLTMLKYKSAFPFSALMFITISYDQISFFGVTEGIVMRKSHTVQFVT